MLFKNSQNSLLFTLTSEKSHLYFWTYSQSQVLSPLKCKELSSYQLFSFLNVKLLVEQFVILEQKD